MGSSGGGGTSVTRTEPAPYVKPYSIDMMDKAGNLSNQKYKQYPGQQIADFNQQQLMGLNAIQNRAFYGDPLTNATQNMGVKTMQGGYMPPKMQSSRLDNNPYLGKTTSGVDSQINTGTNQYLGNNQYLNNAINYTLDDVKQYYQDVQAPQLAAQEVLQGAFGNTGLQDAKNKQLSDYTKNVGRVSNDMRMADYNLQAQLAEADLNRRMQADLANQNMAQYNSGLEQADLSRNTNLQQNINQANALADYNANVNNQQAWQTERANQMNMAGMAPGLAQSQYNDARMLLGVGDTLRDLHQQQLGSAYGDWNAMQQWPYQQLDVLQNAIRTSMGGGSTSSTSSPGASKAGNILGGGLLAYGMGKDAGLWGV